jgi:hypothetical protein
MCEDCKSMCKSFIRFLTNKVPRTSAADYAAGLCSGTSVGLRQASGSRRSGARFEGLKQLLGGG